jgi:ribose transport system permease protein
MDIPNVATRSLISTAASWWPAGHPLARSRAILIAIGVFALLFLLTDWISPGPLTYFDVTSVASGGTPLALAAVGQTLVILSGGFDLSAGAVVSLINTVLATYMNGADPQASILLWTAVGIAVGMAVGAFNGFFVGLLGLQPIVVTLSTMFIVQGGTLLVMEKPGGFIAPSLGNFYMGDAIPGLVPASVVLLAVVLLLWAWLKRTRYGIALYAVGSDSGAAATTGIRVPYVIFATYVLAGGVYGLAGVFVSAQMGSGDPLVGNSLMLSIFAAVVIGGTRLGGGKGSPVGSVFGAFILMIIVNILLGLNVSAYYATIAEGCVLLIAVLLGSLSRDSVLSAQIRHALGVASAYQGKLLVWQRDQTDRRLPFAAQRASAARVAGPRPSFLQSHAEIIRQSAPAYVCLVIVLVVSQFVLGNVFTNFSYWNSLLVLSSFLAVLALGQGAVILTGGLDMSLPWNIAFSGVVLAGMVRGSDTALLYAVPLVLLLGGAVGLVNGIGVVMLGLSPIVVTLAMNGILEGAALLYSNGTPAGYSSPMLRWFMTGRILGVTPVVVFLFVFVVVGTLLLVRTRFGRYVYAVGNSLEAARLSGVPTGRVLISVYVLSGLCAAIVGILLTGFSGQASLGMGDDYLLPSIAVVVVGGALITGGRGHYLGMIGGALLLTALQTLLAGTTLPYAFRAILFGCVVLVAVIALRERRSS